MKEIYLAGKVPKGDKDAEGFVNWRVKWGEVLSKVFQDAQVYMGIFRFSSRVN